MVKFSRYGCKTSKSMIFRGYLVDTMQSREVWSWRPKSSLWCYSPKKFNSSGKWWLEDDGCLFGARGLGTFSCFEDPELQKNGCFVVEVIGSTVALLMLHSDDNEDAPLPTDSEQAVLKTITPRLWVFVLTKKHLRVWTLELRKGPVCRNRKPIFGKISLLFFFEGFLKKWFPWQKLGQKTWDKKAIGPPSESHIHQPEGHSTNHVIQNSTLTCI